MRFSRPVLIAIATALLALPARAAADACPGAGSCPYAGVTQVGQPAGGTLRFPQGVALDGAGNAYVGDQGSHVVQVFDPAGNYVRSLGAPGSRPGELTAVGALAVAGDGSVFVADGTDRVDRFDAAGSLLGSFGSHGASTGQFSFGGGRGNDAGAGGGLAVSGSTVFVADSGNDRIERFSLDGSNATELVPPGLLAHPKGLAVRRTRLFVADDQHHRVVVMDTGGRQLATIGSEGISPGQLSYPYGVAADSAGRVFVADDLNHRVSRFSGAPNYAYKARFGSYGTAPGQLAYPRGIATDGAGSVYVTDTGNDRVDVFDRGGTLLRSFGSSGRAPGQFNTPLGAATDAAGITAVTDGVNGRIQLLRPDGSLAAVWGSPNPGPTVLPSPVAVVFDAAGNAYVLDQRRARIVVFDRATGQPSRTIASQGSGPGQLLDPTALAIDAGGTLSVADSGNGRVARFNAADGGYLGALTQTGTLRGIAVTPDGSRTYVAGTNNRITVFAPDGSELDEFGGTGRKVGKLSAPGQMTLDAAQNLWVADRGNNRVEQFGPNGERLGAFGERGTEPGQFVHPTGVSVSCDGSLTVTDTEGNRVQRFALTSAPGAGCGALPPVAVPPTPKSPTLPAPDGPVVSLRLLRTRGLLGPGGVPVRVGCDTPCTVTATATLTVPHPVAIPLTRQQRRKGRRPPTPKPLAVPLEAAPVTLGAGATRVVRLPVSGAVQRRLRRALGPHRGLDLSVQAVASATIGSPTAISDQAHATR